MKYKIWLVAAGLMMAVGACGGDGLDSTCITVPCGSSEKTYEQCESSNGLSLKYAGNNCFCNVRWIQYTECVEECNLTVQNWCRQ